MARMHSRKKGKSTSNKPSEPTKATWVTYKDNEVEAIIAKLAKEGKTPSQIGIFLRDTYGIPSVKHLINKSITDVLASKELLKEIPEDLMALIKQIVLLRKHIETNKQDQSAKRGLRLAESKVKRLVDYYKRTKKIPMDWKYDVDRIKLYIE